MYLFIFVVYSMCNWLIFDYQPSKNGRACLYIYQDEISSADTMLHCFYVIEVLWVENGRVFVSEWSEIEWKMDE